MIKELSVTWVLVVATSLCHAGNIIDNTKAYANKAMFWKGQSLSSLSFHSVFPKPLHKKSYFGAVLTGTTIVGAGAFTYFTAGAGAPVAATGVSGVASWVAGGGAGSYMAGLSTVGGWFGGNAILGSAVLNGISIGVTGGGAAFATLPVLAKVSVMASVTATALDGVAVFQKPDTKNLSYRIRLTVPEKLGSKDVRQLTKDLHGVERKLLESDPNSMATEYRELLHAREDLLKKAILKGQKAQETGGSNEDLMVLGVLCKNAGRSDLFEKLIKKIPTETMADTGYIDYLKAVTAIENGDTDAATNFLWKSWRLNPYSIEQPLLLLNILGQGRLETNEKELRQIVERATKQFDDDKYNPGYSLVSLNYRLATIFVINKKYLAAQEYFERAHAELSLVQQYLGDKSTSKMIRLGIANSLHGQNKKEEAQKLYEKILANSESDSQKAIVRSLYAGNL